MLKGVVCVLASDPLIFTASLSYFSLSFSTTGGRDARFASRWLGSRSPCLLTCRYEEA